MSNLFNAPLPRLPHAARKAGATEIRRAGERRFLVSFRLTDGGLSEAGHGSAVLDALNVAWRDSYYKATWSGMQSQAIVVEYTGGSRRV